MRILVTGATGQVGRRYVPRLLQRAGADDTVRVLVRDVAQGVTRVLYAPGIAGRVYNVADDAPVSAAELHWLGGKPVPEGSADRPLRHPWEGVVSTLRIRDELGYRPLYPSAWTARDAGAL